MLRPALFLLLFMPLLGQAQKPDRRAVKALQTDIGFLASETLRGPEGERKAADYLVARYEKLKIPAYGSAYRHPFSFAYGLETGNSRIVLGGQSNLLGGEAFPLPFSSNGTVSGEVLVEVQEQGAIWILPLYASAEEAANPRFDWEGAAWKQGREAIRDGATGIVFYDNYGSIHAPRFNPLSKRERLAIPMAFVGNRQWKDLTAAGANMISVALDIKLSEPERNAANVLAWIDNKAPLTVVIAAHYDHLGYGENGEIRNGADDNASGTAALLQLAEWLKKNRLRKYNYLFAHLAGEELGGQGSKAFGSESGIDGSRIACVLDLDMIGRLDDSAQRLTLQGYSSSPAWSQVRDILHQAGFSVDAGGSDRSHLDHASFYRSGIPVLSISAGESSGYHTPDDSIDRINYAGEARIIGAAESILRKLDASPRPAFSGTR